MLDKIHRFHGHNSLRQTYKSGVAVRGPLMSLKFVGNGRRRTYRAAVVVSRKVSKSAVIRNRIRRRIYDVLRRHSAGIAEPYDMVFTVFSKEVAELPAKKLDRLVLHLLHQARIIRPSGRRENRDIVGAKES